MSYLGRFKVDDYVGIPAATHRFSSGAAYAPTSLTYSIYEEATAVGIDENVDMVVASPFDSVTGCYWVRRQLTAAAGFEEGKNYLVLVKATVDGVPAIQMHTFQVELTAPAVNVTLWNGETPADLDGLGYVPQGSLYEISLDSKSGNVVTASSLTYVRDYLVGMVVVLEYTPAPP